MFGVPDRYSFPVRALLWSQIAVMGTLWLLQTILGKDLHAVARVFWGFDYNDFHMAARAWHAGRDPYEVQRFITPPTGAALLLPFAGWAMETVRPYIAAAFTLSLLGALALLNRVFVPEHARKSVFWAGAGTLFLSYPFLFLFDRLNVDGFVMGLVGVFLWALWREEESPNWLLAFIAGAALSLGVGIKLYPALLLLPILLARRWRVLGSFALFMGFQIGGFAHLWGEFFHQRLGLRAEYFAVDENGSLANTLRFFGVVMTWIFGPTSSLANIDLWVSGTPYLFAGLLLVKAVVDGRRVFKKRAATGNAGAAELVVWYVPFMLSVPKTVFHYEFVGLWLMIPAIGAAFAQSGRALRFVSGIAVVGLILSQTHAVAFADLFGTITPHYVPEVGLLLLLLASTIQSVLLTGAPIPNKSEPTPREVPPFRRAALSFLHRP